jgi:hypothetical protein
VHASNDNVEDAIRSALATTSRHILYNEPPTPARHDVLCYFLFVALDSLFPYLNLLQHLLSSILADHVYYSDIHLLIKRDMPFHLDPSRYAKSTVPTLEDYRGLWAVWDTVTRGMIPNDELLNKPIKLRNACIFYLGHIPTFLDMQLSKATNEPLCEPSYYSKIFERGIDPDVDNPDHCHAHSEIPEAWPPLSEILGYQSQVRGKVEALYRNKTSDFPRNIGRCLWIGFEHEIMHLETLLYMLLQSDKTLPPPRTITPDFKKDAELAAKASVPNEWFTIPEQQVVIGLEDPEDNSGPDAHFGWYAGLAR